MTTRVVYYIYLAFGKMNPTCPVGVVMQISHLFVLNCQVQPLCCVCGSCRTWKRKAYTAGSCQHKQGLERNCSSQERLGGVQLFQRRSLSQLGTLWRCRSTLPFCSCGISGGTVWADVAKMLPEESLSRGLWVKGNTVPCPEHLRGLPLGALLNPICQHPSRSDECTLPSCLSWDAGHARRVTQEENGRMEKESSGKSFKTHYHSSVSSLIHCLLSWLVLYCRCFICE